MKGRSSCSQKAERVHMDVNRPGTKKHLTFHHAHGHFLLELQTQSSAVPKKMISVPHVKTVGKIQ